MNSDLSAEGDHSPSPAEKLSPPPSAAQANPETGRDAQGKFVKGCKGGPGNPFARQTAAYRRAFRAAVSEEDIQAMARLLRKQALEGNLAALKLVFLYTIGKPSESVDPDLLDAQELQLFQRQVATSEQMVPVLQGMQAELACELLRAAVPEVQQSLQEQLHDGLKASLLADEARKAAAAKQAEEKSARRRKKLERRDRSRPAEPTGYQTGETEDQEHAKPVVPSPNGSNGANGSQGQVPETRRAALQPPSAKRDQGQAESSQRGKDGMIPPGWPHDLPWYLDLDPDRRRKHRHRNKKKKKKRKS